MKCFETRLWKRSQTIWSLHKWKCKLDFYPSVLEDIIVEIFRSVTILYCPQIKEFQTLLKEVTTGLYHAHLSFLYHVMNRPDGWAFPSSRIWSFFGIHGKNTIYGWGCHWLSRPFWDLIDDVTLVDGDTSDHICIPIGQIPGNMLMQCLLGVNSSFAEHFQTQFDNMPGY